MPRRILGAALALVLLGTGLGATRAALTDAAWADSEYAAATFAGSSGILAPTALQCVPRTSALTFAVPLNWMAPVAVAGYRVPGAYEVQVTTTSGSVVYDTYVTTTSTVLTAGLLAIGTYVIRVRGVSTDHSWSSAWITDGVSLLSPVGYTCTT